MMKFNLVTMLFLMFGTVNANAYRVDFFHPKAVKAGTRQLVCSFNVGDNKASGLLPGAIVIEATDIPEEKFKSTHETSSFWETVKITGTAWDNQESEEIEVIATLDRKNSKKALSSIVVIVRSLTQQRILNYSREVQAHDNVVDYRGTYSKDLDVKVRCLLKSP